ncbi:peptidase M20 domain-containing protein 2-like [Clupea harengus]|uniref:Peptidase M20 domain-containing protein 2-like n=1 Tax=Clupea harengus TaxID=7950 RepID=A0A8M1KGK6_CLUHA|nr:peptidase M20 domain-containing protein 2-like [Clupea harengus]
MAKMSSSRVTSSAKVILLVWILKMRLLVFSSMSGSTDFGNVSFVVPGIHPYFYIGSDALNHTKEYTVASGSETAQFYTLRTAKALARTALDVLFCPEMMQRAKTEFNEVKMKKDK